MKPDDAEAYNGLANVYNAQRKFDEAAAASAKANELAAAAPGGAGGGGSADSLYNQGVILWNSGKIADAKKRSSRRSRPIRTTPRRITSSGWRS